MVVPGLAPVHAAQIGRATARVYIGAYHVGHYLAPLPSPMGDRLAWLTGDGQFEDVEVRDEGGCWALVFRDEQQLARTRERTEAKGVVLFDLDAANFDRGELDLAGIGRDRDPAELISKWYVMRSSRADAPYLARRLVHWQGRAASTQDVLQGGSIEEVVSTLVTAGLAREPMPSGLPDYVLEIWGSA